MALSNPMSGQLPSQVSMDTDPLTPQVVNRYRPTFSLSSRNMSADALAGPEDASRRSTQELKEEARREEARQAAQRRPENLSIEKLPPKMGGGPRSGSRDELDQVESEIRARVNDMSINKGGDSSYSSLSSSSCSSMPSANWEDELNLYKDKMPPEIRIGYIDVLILYCEDDRPAAEKFQNHLRTEIDLPNGPVETLLYDDAEMQSICGSKIQHLAKGVERSTYVFIFMTKNFIEDKWCEFSSESCLMEAITNPDKQWCVVPVYTEKRNSSFRVPMGLNTLKGINYYNNDRFYRNGVSRLIGDKISVRKQANENHKIKQKKWLEEQKRKEIQLRENQERIARIEEARTQQLVDWLDRETRRLVRDGILPDSLHHSSSESDISSQNSSLSHSSSTSSLKPVHTQHPAVISYFQKLLGQQAFYGWNEQRYDQNEMAIIQQMYGHTSPVTPGIFNNVSPPVMNSYQRQFSPGQFNQGQSQIGQGNGYFPPVATSASYPQQYPHQVKRSQSQASADMGPSTLFQLHTATGDRPVAVPSELFEKIQDKPDSEQQRAVQFYLDQRKVAENQQQQEAGNQPAIGTRNQFLSTRQSSASDLPPQANVYGSNLPGGVPNFEAMYSSMNNQQTGSDYSTEQNSRSYPSGITDSVSSNRSASAQQLGSNMDGGNRSHPEGNLPNLFDSMDPDGGSMNSRQMYTSARGEEIYEVKNSTVTGEQTDSESDEEKPDVRNKKTKGKQKKVVHIHKTVIYQPQVVQIGDHNIVHQPDSENSANDSEGEEQVSDVKETPGTEEKINEENNTSKNEKHQLMNVEIKPGSETHGEMPDQPNSSGTNSSCNVDAAPSATVNHLSGISQEEPKPGGKRVVETKKLTAIKSIGDDQVEIEDAEEVLPDDACEKFKNNFENSSKFDDSIETVGSEKRFDESVNINSSASEEKSSSLKRKQMPNEGVATQRQEKPVGIAKPVAAVTPFSPKVADDYDDNCDNTDPKTVVKSAQTVRKSAVSSQECLESTEQTFVKQAWTTANIPPSVKTETQQLQRNVPAQMLTKAANLNDYTSNGSAKFANFNHHDPHRLFYQRNVTTAEIPDSEPSSLDSEVNISGPQQVALGNDPLSRETQEDAASKSFIPQSSPFSPQLSENDLEYDMLGEEEISQSTSSFEESGTKLNKSWNRRGSPPGGSKKECVIS